MERSESVVMTSPFVGSGVFSLASTTLQIAANTLGILNDDLSNNDLASLNHLPNYSLAQVAFHDTIDDCWVVIYDKVYDLTPFLRQHPGGYDVILEYAGRDSTLAFRGVGHSADANLMMEKYCVGVLIEKERIYLRKKKKSLFG